MNKNGKDSFIILLLTVISSLLGIFVFFTGKNFPDLFSSDKESFAAEKQNNELNISNRNNIDENAKQDTSSKSTINNDEGDGEQKNKSEHRYQLFDDGGTQKEAINKCEELGGHLLTITSEEEQEYISNMLRESKMKNIWLGAELFGDDWRWITGEEFVYQNWISGEPNNVGNIQNAIMMYAYDGIDNDGNRIFIGGWNDESPDGRNWEGYSKEETGYICEWE